MGSIGDMNPWKMIAVASEVGLMLDKAGEITKSLDLEGDGALAK